MMKLPIPYEKSKPRKTDWPTIDVEMATTIAKKRKKRKKDDDDDEDDD